MSIITVNPVTNTVQDLTITQTPSSIVVDVGGGAGVTDHGALTGLLDDDHTQYQKKSEKAAASGYASLDSGTKVPVAQLPDATTAAKGVVELATDGEVAVNVAVQGNDTRLSNARTPTAHQSSHQSGGSDPLAGNLDAVARTDVRKNSTGSVFSRRRLNLIEGSNITLTVADDAGAEEVDVTITGAAGGAGHTIMDEGSALTARTNLDFVGIGVTVTDNAGANKSVVTIPGGTAGTGYPTLTVATKTAAYTLVDADDVILGDATASGFTITLPTAVGRTGAQFVIKRINTNANIVTIATTSSQTIDGATTYELITPHAGILVVSDGANWRVIGEF
jgi:hypothetical protein